MQISNRDLLHAVVGMYDVSLSEMTPDVIYATVCERWARTVILVRDLKGKGIIQSIRTPKKTAVIILKYRTMWFYHIE